MRSVGDVQIGKAAAPVSHICQAYPDRVEVRGRDLCGDLMGRLSFTEYFHLLLTGREPTEEQRYFLDLLLISIAEHGMMPTNVAARMTLAADPGSLQGALAAGILGPARSSSARPKRVRACSKRRPRPVGRRGIWSRSCTRPATRFRALDIPFTSRSTRAPSEFSSWRTSVGSAGRTSRSHARSAKPFMRSGASR